AGMACRNFHGRAKRRIRRLATAFIGGIKAVAEQIEKNPGDVLWDELERRDRPIELAFQGDVEALIPGAGPVECEVERFLDEAVDVGALPLAAAAARMRQHALDD